MCECDDEDCNCDNSDSKFKADQKVYSLMYGNGKVSVVNTAVWVEHNFGTIVYTLDGRFKNSPGISKVVLFHDKPTIIPAKPKVKKYRWAYQCGNDTKISDYFSERGWRGYSASKGSIKLPWTEIEE